MTPNMRKIMGNAWQARWQRWLTLGIGLGALNIVSTALPSWSAERLTVSYGAFERSVDIDDLELFATEGIQTEVLQSYTRYFDPEMVEQVRQILNQRAEIDLETVDRFLYTIQGEYLLNIAAEVIRTAGYRQDFKALRGALIVSAADQTDGLTLINFMRNFPTPAIRVDLAKGFAIANEIDRVIYQTNTAVQFIDQLALTEAENTPLPATELATLEQVSRPGPYRVERVALRTTALPADIYLPLNDRGRLQSRPAVVISHGLGSDVTSYRYLANHLASHGFVAINVEHPDSSADQINALLTGQAATVVPNEEFIQRPSQISQLLDELEVRTSQSTRWRNVIDFQRVGVLGQSFGGYTALALAGAPIDFSSLGNSCPPEAVSLNISLLLQCQASLLAETEQTQLDLSDDRIKVAIAINPISSVLFGQQSVSQIETPTLIMSSGADTVAPALTEQIRPFTWLTTEERYLVMLPIGTHFSTIGVTASGSEAVDLPPAIIGERPDLAQAYVNAVSLAFVQTHLLGESNFQPILTSAAIEALSENLSQNQMPLSLIQGLTPAELQSGLTTPPPTINEADIYENRDIDTIFEDLL